MNSMHIKKIASLVWIAAGCFAAATTHANPYTAQIRSGDKVFQVTDNLISSNSLERTFTLGGKTLYATNVTVEPNVINISVVKAHASQLGRFKVSAGKSDVFDANGAPLWSEPLKTRMCPPEMLGEFVRAHWAFLQTDKARAETVLVLSMMLSKRLAFIFCQILTRSRSAPCIRPTTHLASSISQP